MNIILHEANGLQIGQRREDGYINLTKMAQASGKSQRDYLKLDTTKAFIEELSINTGIPVFNLTSSRTGKPTYLQGIWGHPQIAINCGQWCSPQFAVLVSKWVVDWMTIASNLTEQSRDSALSKAAKVYIESSQALNRLIHTAIHQQTDSIREALKALESSDNSTVLISPNTQAPDDTQTFDESLLLAIPSHFEDNGNNSRNDTFPSKKRRHWGEGNGTICWRTITKNGKDYPQAYYHWKENGKKRTKYIPQHLLGIIQQAEREKCPVIEILKLLGVGASYDKLGHILAIAPKTEVAQDNEDSRSPSKIRRDKGEGSGTIHWRTITKNDKDYPQAYYHYEFWSEGDRLSKSSRYIPKRLLSQVQQLDVDKAPVREILQVLRVVL